ncbi:MAG: hypothetical protein M1376_12060 [Planctomycetes bacterium]|nr:hypothetical protein [Planctomycetota bacterium]
MKIREYYATPDVRSRMIESLGGSTLAEATCYYIGRCFDTIKPGFCMQKPGELDLFLQNEWDVARSLWDRKWLFADIDIEYVNFDFPAEPFLDYQRCFALQEPVLHALERVFAEAGIQPLHTITGRGHHFGWTIAPASPAFRSLERIGRVPPALQRTYAAPQPPEGKPVDRALGRAFAGLGLVVEYVAHRVMEEAQPLCPIPILPEAVDRGPQERGKEIIVLDISEYGDPLHTRAVRMPFSIYLKPWLHTDILTPEIEGRVPVMVMVPAGGRETEQVTPIMRSRSKAAQWASQVSGAFPDCSAGMERLIAQYLRSEVRRFHEEYYSVEPEPAEQWPLTYDRVALEGLVPMARYALENPNDALLRPDFVRQVVAGLLERGWHPRHIAGLIRSKYERDYRWWNLWYIYDAGTRADFHTRVLAGMIWLGRDRVESGKGEKQPAKITLSEG